MICDDYLLRCGWTQEGHKFVCPITGKEYYLMGAFNLQRERDKELVPTKGDIVPCLWNFQISGTKVLDTFILWRDRFLILGNTDGYDDWARILIKSSGSFNGKRYDYIAGERY